MKKINYFLVFLFVIIASLKANAFNITVNVDDASRVTVYLGSSKLALSNGDNAFDVKTGDRLYFSANTGYVLKSVMNGSTAETISSLTSCIIGLDEATHTDAKWVVTTSPLDDVRTATCKVIVDDASKVTIGLSGTYTTVALVTGENNVKFVPDVESPFAISAKESSATLYSVKKNSEPVSPSYGTYRVDVADGDIIEIQASFPDEDYSVKFNLSEKAAGFITKVQVNGTEVENYMDDIFTVKAGSQVDVEGNTNDYTLESFKVNGSSVDFSQSIMALEDTEISFRASGASKIKSLKYGMNAVEPQEDGTYRVVLTVDSDINVEVGVASGIENVMPSDEEANNVYTMDGILVMKNASRSQIDGLAKGMYIINGKKLIR